jgi:hypothetical protein
MKSTIYTFLLGLCGLILFQSFDSKGLKKVDGTDPGYTGSPGDSLKNCTVCHGGSAIAVAGWITSDIPAAGFIPGNTYKITATNTSASHNRFGFSVSPQAIDGRLLGTIIATDTARTQINGNGKYITYRPAGVPNNNVAVWNFNWVAPTDGTKEVVFYGAFNSNQDGHKGSDLTRLSTLKVFQEGFSSVAEAGSGFNLSIFPNPSAEKLNLSIANLHSGETSIKLFDLSGAEITSYSQVTNAAGNFQKSIDISMLENGIYLVQIENGKQSITKKIVVVQ